MARLEDVLKNIHGNVVGIAHNQRNVFLYKADLVTKDSYKDNLATFIRSEDRAFFEQQPW